MTPSPLVLYFDGASRGNPGPAAYGVYSPSGVRLGERIGTTTNNVAEWRGFLAALDAAIAAGAQHVEIRADSQLVLKQFTGEYRMKAAHLAGYLREAREKARRIRHLDVRHVPRAQNHQADRLANEALDGAVVEAGTAKSPARSPFTAPDGAEGIASAKSPARSPFTAPDGAEGIASAKSPATASKQRPLFEKE